MISVIMAAHNEERSIGRSVSALLRDAAPGELEIVVVANGCTDRTAEVAASFGPDVRVIETPVASKYHALNLGETVATAFPRFYVDADVEVDTATIRELAGVLERGEALAAAPALRIDVDGCPRSVRAYHRIWSRLPSIRDDLAGRGVYAVSREGRGRFATFPDVIADDRFVRDRFLPAERRCVTSRESVVQAPGTLADLTRRKTRVLLGNRQLSARFGETASAAGESRQWLAVVRDDPRLLTCVPVYLYVSVLARLRAAQRMRRDDYATWDRDESNRLPQGAGS